MLQFADERWYAYMDCGLTTHEERVESAVFRMRQWFCEDVSEVVARFDVCDVYDAVTDHLA